MGRGERATIALVILVVLATHLTYQSCSNGDFYFPDSYTYLTPALSLVHGNGFTTEGDPETLRTPGYPLFLVPFLALHAPDWSIVLVQHLLDALLAAAIYIAARKRGASRAAAVAGALVLAFDVVTIRNANKILSETLSAAVLFAIFCVATRLSAPNRGLKPAATLAVTAGLLCGVLVMVRPIAIAYFGVVMICLALTRVPARAIAAFLIAALVLPAGWATRNLVETGHFTISTAGAINILLHSAAGALAIEEGGDFDERERFHSEQLERIANKTVIENEGEENIDEINSADIAPYYTALGRRILLEHPRGAVLVAIRGFLVNMADTDWESLDIVSNVPSDITQVVVTAWTWLLWFGCAIGLVTLWRTDRFAALLIAGSIVYFLLLAAASVADARYRDPVIPLMAFAVTSLSRSPLRYSTSRPTSSRASDRTESH